MFQVIFPEQDSDLIDVLIFTTEVGTPSLCHVCNDHTMYSDMGLPIGDDVEHKIQSRAAMRNTFPGYTPMMHPMFSTKCTKKDLEEDEYDKVHNTGDWDVILATLVDEDGIFKKLPQNPYFKEFKGTVCVWAYLLSRTTGIHLDLHVTLHEQHNRPS